MHVSASHIALHTSTSTHLLSPFIFVLAIVHMWNPVTTIPAVLLFLLTDETPPCEFDMFTNEMDASKNSAPARWFDLPLVACCPEHHHHVLAILLLCCYYAALSCCPQEAAKSRHTCKSHWSIQSWWIHEGHQVVGLCWSGWRRRCVLWERHARGTFCKVSVARMCGDPVTIRERLVTSKANKTSKERSK